MKSVQSNYNIRIAAVRGDVLHRESVDVLLESKTAVLGREDNVVGLIHKDILAREGRKDQKCSYLSRLLHWAMRVNTRVCFRACKGGGLVSPCICMSPGHDQWVSMSTEPLFQ